MSEHGFSCNPPAKGMAWNCPKCGQEDIIIWGSVRPPRDTLITCPYCNVSIKIEEARSDVLDRVQAEIDKGLECQAQTNIIQSV